jgi:hypothetical protein
LGLSQIPFTNSSEQAGEYPERPAFLFSHRIGKTSGRPANKRRNSAIFVFDGEFLLTGGISATRPFDCGAAIGVHLLFTRLQFALKRNLLCIQSG